MTGREALSGVRASAARREKAEFPNSDGHACYCSRSELMCPAARGFCLEVTVAGDISREFLSAVFKDFVLVPHRYCPGWHVRYGLIVLKKAG